MSAFSWPALEGIESLLAGGSLELLVRRGVWGKVHGARSDFRWITRSEGFGVDLPRLEAKLWAGPEETPARAAFWRSLEDRWLAVATYPSRAVDRSGRRGFCERQVLETRPAAPLPAAAAALLLLPEAAAYDDGLWWDRSPELAAAPDLVLPVHDGLPSRLTVTRQGLAEALRLALAQLAATAVCHDLVPRLGRLYTALLSPAFAPGRDTVVLDGLPGPLPGMALGTLLLPLPRALADRLSLAGWLFSEGVSWPALAENWQVVTLPPGSPSPLSGLPDSADAEGLRWAEALLAGRPPTGPAWSFASAPTPPRPPVRAAPPSPPTEPDGSGAPRGVLTLPAPGPGICAVLWEVFDFARAVDRRWLAPDVIAETYGREPHPGPLSSDERDLLLDWIGEVTARRPPLAHELQWQVKVDLLRALALAVVPSPETFARVGTFASGRVPPLLYAPVFQAGPAMLRERLGDGTYERCREQGRGCRSRRWVRWVEEWAEPTNLLL